MKKRLLAIMNENGKYLAEFEANDGRVLAYTTNWHEAFEHALKVDWDAIKDDEANTQRLKYWADSVEAKLVVIEIDYQVTELETGEDREEYVDRIGNALKDIFDALTTDDIDELDEEDMEDIYG
ncbi:hypothetical protein [Jeotgalibaca porci]|uniref:hypothetical protein n=1 Tax=Jeotgalibaca porci TaxID=1868793 RepID=UPI0035A0F9BB